MNKQVKGRLKSLKEHSRESYCDVIERLINVTVDDEPLSDETLRGIEEASDRKLSIEIAYKQPVLFRVSLMRHAT